MQQHTTTTVEALLADLTPAERQRVARLVQHTGCPIDMAVAAVKATRSTR